MNVISTRGAVPPTPIAAAIAAGLASDGGLFVPERLPQLPLSAFDGRDTLPAVAATLLHPLFADTELVAELPAMCRAALSFATPLVALDEHTSVLELFHGPTAAFKDIGARFLASCFVQLPDIGDRTILVATSGDTGGAVADAFFERAGIRVVILYPDGKVSPRQAHLLSCYGRNVRTFKVAGTFDDCQRLVKQAFGDRELRVRLSITSANSISLGRLLPQMTYYAHSALHFFRERGRRLNYVVPTGNLGNALACLYARAIGLPIGEVVLATNDNRVLPEFFDGLDYQPRPSVATLANAMDVGDPSNFERLRQLYRNDDELRSQVSAQWVTDEQILHRIDDWHRRFGRAICPHTAAGAEVRERIHATGDSRPWCVVATAHPAKFEGVVEPRIGNPIDPPASMQRLLARPAVVEPLTADYDAFRAALVRE